ncbi:NAD(P)H-binding protein [Streptomyces sp. NPDC026672]|uniref:SDR family oxidoreductase n=1 Tax=unclassified Streptomyces TaxID=2593676 RepID=UPI0033C86CF4
MRVAVAGGTGWVGRLTVDALRGAGHEVRVVARSTGVDLTTGAGLDGALDGVGAVIDATNVVTTGRAKSVAFFETTTANLLRAEEHAGVKHHVVLSIVGCDTVDLGYYYGKRAQERAVAAGGVPWTVLRATQFHEFAAQMLERGGPVVIAPRMLSRPVAGADVARVLVRLALAEPLRGIHELAGPEDLQMVDMVRGLARARGLRRPVLPIRLPGAVGRAVAGGALLPSGPVEEGGETYDTWLTRTSEPHHAE